MSSFKESIAQNYFSETALPKISQWFSNFSVHQRSNSNATFDRTFVVLGLTMYMLGLVMVATSSIPVGERLKIWRMNVEASFFPISKITNSLL
jgi:cell division protein FtsW